MRGVVDSEDLPLNISREMLQNNPQVAQMRKALTGRVLGELETLAGKDAEAYAKIWEAFGRVLKEGIYEDHERRDAAAGAGALRHDHGRRDALAQAIRRRLQAEPDRDLLSRRRQPSSASSPIPKLEAARARGIEVLLLTDPVDAFWTAMPLDFEGKPLKSLSQGEVDFGLVPLLESAKPADDRADARAVDDAVVIAAVKAALDERVSEVRASTAPDRQRRLPGRRRHTVPIASSSACWRGRTAAPAPSRSWS